VEKSLYGRKYMGTERSTFVIGPDGKIQAIFRKVKPAEHVDQLLAALTP
jgi:peroxiredoxin Q/BCP